MGSPFTRIAWHLMPWTIWFDLFSVAFSDGSMAPSFLALWSSSTVDALPFYWLVIFSCICVVFVFFVCCNYVVCCVFCCIVFVSIVVVLLSTLLAGLWVIMYVIFADYFVWVWGFVVITVVFPPSRLSGRRECVDFQWSYSHSLKIIIIIIFEIYIYIYFPFSSI